MEEVITTLTILKKLEKPSPPTVEGNIVLFFLIKFIFMCTEYLNFTQ